MSPLDGMCSAVGETLAGEGRHQDAPGARSRDGGRLLPARGRRASIAGEGCPIAGRRWRNFGDESGHSADPARSLDVAPRSLEVTPRVLEFITRVPEVHTAVQEISVQSQARDPSVLVSVNPPDPNAAARASRMPTWRNRLLVRGLNRTPCRVPLLPSDIQYRKGDRHSIRR